MTRPVMVPFKLIKLKVQVSTLPAIAEIWDFEHEFEPELDVGGNEPRINQTGAG